MSWVILAGVYLFVCGAAILCDALEHHSEPQNSPSAGLTDHA